MSAGSSERSCAETGIRLVPARGEIAFRVAKDRYGALSVRQNSVVGPMPVGVDPQVGDPRGRFDTMGSTIYLADSRACAYAEVLVGFRKNRASIAKVAESVGWNVDEYIDEVLRDAQNNQIDAPWGISVDWQMDRSIYEIRLPRTGWWVRIDHAETLAALEGRVSNVLGMAERLKLLTSGAIEGEDRDLTSLLAHTLRGLTLDDGSEPLGVSYASKSLQGRCWAYWDRRADAGLPTGSNNLLQLTSENVGPDPEFARIARFYQLPILAARH